MKLTKMLTPEAEAAYDYRQGGYAHFPGTGPRGRQCQHCRHKTRVKGYGWICDERVRMGLPKGKKRPAKIDLRAPACNRFAQGETFYEREPPPIDSEEEYNG